MGKKGSGSKAKTTKEVKVKEKGPKPDYKLPRIPKDIFKTIHPTDLNTAKLQLIAASKKDKWIYKISYKTLKQEKYNGGLMIFKK